jgi:hypothetical protein
MANNFVEGQGSQRAVVPMMMMMMMMMIMNIVLWTVRILYQNLQL